MKSLAIDIDEAQIQAFCEQHHIRRMALFGSVLRDDFTPESDVDVLVEFEPGTRIGLIGLGEIEGALSDQLRRKVDLNTPDMLSKYFREKVLSEAETIYVAA